MRTMRRKNNLAKIACGCAAGLLAISVCMNAAGPVICKAESKSEAQTVKEETFSGRCLNIGSVSKIYTVTAVMQLVDQGKVDLDAPVTDYITDFKMADDRYHKITVRMLMNHTSGLMGTVYGGIFLFDDVDGTYHDSFLSILQKEELKYEPGAFNCYCNDGFTLLEILVERVSGMTFTQYLEEKVCKPLSLSETGTAWNMDASELVPAYVNGNVRTTPERGAGVGAGGIISSAREVCEFGATFFSGNRALLSEKAKKEMAKDYATGYSKEAFGLGWDEVRKADYEKAGMTVLSKGGDTFYHNASLVVAPEESISVAVLASGGGSGVDEELALALMDVALEAQGISVDHPKEEKPELSNVVPKEYLSYEGLYADAHGTVSISFPNGQYMKITSVTYDREFEKQYMYSGDGVFFEVSGDVASGKAIPLRPYVAEKFEEWDGQVYLVNPEYGCALYKASESRVEEKVQKAWEKRDGVSYYYVSGPAADVTYSVENCCVTLHTSEAARGYVNGHLMQDETHAGYETILPDTASRDLSNLRMETAGGKEYLCMDEYNYKYISEECIPVFTGEITEVALKTKEASWFRIDGAKNLTLRLELPEKAAAYVYDQYGNLRFSSYLAQYGKEVPLPEYGMIVFVGETGGSVQVSAIN